MTHRRKSMIPLPIFQAPLIQRLCNCCACFEYSNVCWFQILKGPTKVDVKNFDPFSLNEATLAILL